MPTSITFPDSGNDAQRTFSDRSVSPGSFRKEPGYHCLSCEHISISALTCFDTILPKRGNLIITKV